VLAAALAGQTSTPGKAGDAATSSTADGTPTGAQQAQPNAAAATAAAPSSATAKTAKPAPNAAAALAAANPTPGGATTTADTTTSATPTTDPTATATAAATAAKAAATDAAAAKAAAGTDPSRGTAATPDGQAAPQAPTLANQLQALVDPQTQSGAAQSTAVTGVQATQAQTSTTDAATTSLNATLANTANSAVPLAGLGVAITAQAQVGRNRFEIRLDPPELGRIDVRLDVDSKGQVTSHLTVDKPETLDLLRRDAPQLQQALEDAGLKTGDSGLQFSLRDQSSSSGGQGNGSNQTPQRLVVAEDDTVPAQVAGLSYGRMLSSSGGVDIRV
jgi:flagellar hook-length control protein FliK